MIDEFRAAFQELIGASVTTDPHQFRSAVHRVHTLASQVPAEERELALEALDQLLTQSSTAPGVTADLCVVAGALVETGTTPGPAGVRVLRLLRTMGQGATVFLNAWDRTGSGPPPHPDQVTAAVEERVATDLGETAPGATLCWWTIHRHALAASTMLGAHSVRAAVRADPELHAELVAIANQLSRALPEFDAIRGMLRMAEATSALVLHRDSGRGFRVLFDGIGDNFQLHTLLADALIGESAHGLPGPRPDPRWVAAFRDGDTDPQARVVQGWWNLVAADGTWVWNEGVPADIPTVEGEHVLILDTPPYPRSFTAARRHRHVPAWLEVEQEVSAEEAAQWWRRVAPSTTVTGPAVGPDQGEEDEGDVHAFVTRVLARASGATTAPEEPETADERPPAGEGAPSDSAASEPADGTGTGPQAPPPTEALPVLDLTNAAADTGDTATEAADDDTTEDSAAPGAHLLPPLPPGVSEDSAWGPRWL